MSSDPQHVILNVDDNEAGRYAVTKTLKNAGFAVMEAACGLDALKLAPKADLVVLDVNLPDINGFEVCRRLKSDPVTSRIPVLHLSATYLDTESTEQGLEGGAEAYLTHPVEPKVLVAYAKALLRTHSLEAELIKSNSALKAITECHIAILRAQDEAGLTSDVCRVLVEVGGYRMAWVGYAEHDKDKTLRPIAHSGHEEGYLDTVRVTWSEDEAGNGPTRTAIRTGEPCLSNFFCTDPDMEPWRSEGIKRGYAASLAIPLIAQGSILGALNIYASMADVFSQETIKFLGQLADDLSYGIESLRVKEQAKKSVVELHVHQAELEMQNEELKTTQANLEESKEKYQDLYDFAPVGYFTLNHKRIISEANLSGAELLGAPRSKLINMRFGQFVDPEFEDQYYRHIIGVFRQEEKQSCELNLRREDGSIFYARLESLRREAIEQQRTDGSTYEARIAVTDITDRKLAEEALRTSEERFRILFESANDGILILDNATFIDCNPKALQMYGCLKKQDIVGHTPMEFSPQRQPDGLDSREMALKHIERALNSNPQTFFWKHCRRDGSLFDVETTLNALTVKGKRYLQAIVRDITERSRAQETQKMLFAAIEHAAEGIVITDSAGTIQYVNPAEETISGYNSEELIGRSANIFKGDQQDQDFYANMWATIKAGKIWSGRFINRKKDGVEYHEDNSISPVYNNSGELINFVAVKHDVTKQMQLQEQLFQAQKMEAIGTITGGFAHDFNNKLSVVTGYVDLILSSPDLPETFRHDLKMIKKAVEGSAELINGMMAFSRKTTVKLEPLNLNTIVGQFSSLLTPVMTRRIEIELVMADDIWTINASPSQIDQTLMNLAINAKDAMPDGGKLLIQTQNTILDEEFCRGYPNTKPGRYVMLSVTDSGKGMDSETVKRIFEPFFTTKEKGKGTGLGLAVVYGIVEKHGGMITCDSQPSAGTTFQIYFPSID